MCVLTEKRLVEAKIPISVIIAAKLSRYLQDLLDIIVLILAKNHISVIYATNHFPLKKIFQCIGEFIPKNAPISVGNATEPLNTVVNYTVI